MGPDDAGSASLATGERRDVSVMIQPTQRVIGVYGFKTKSLGTLRSVSFKLANEVHVVVEQEFNDIID